MGESREVNVRINEIFYSIQGEGIHQGVPMVFIRFQGCNLIPGCDYCDTKYARVQGEGENFNYEEVLQAIRLLDPRQMGWVCITGGEPLWQLYDLENLVGILRSEGIKASIETNGSYPIPQWYTKAESWVADIKCPSSGVCGTSKDDWLFCRQKDQVKFVVGTQEDLEFVENVLKRTVGKTSTVIVSPTMPSSQEFMQKIVEFCKEHKVRFSLQWHKIIWGDKRGV